MKAQSDLISIVLISAIVVAAGITLWVFYSGYASAARLSAQEEINRELRILRSAISADYVLCPQGEALIRNVGKEPVTIFRLILYKNEELVWDSLRVYGIDKLAEIDVGDKANVRFTCPATYLKEDVVMLQVHYVPKSLFDPSIGLIDASSDVLLFKVANFKAEKVSLALAEKVCPDEPQNWAWIDFVDPEEAPPYGNLGQRIGVRIPEANGIFDMSLRVNVEGASGSKYTVASVASLSDETQWINIDMSGLRHPVTITFEAVSPEDFNVLQREWYFDAIDTSYINYIKLMWNSLDKKLVGAYVSIFHIIPGTYNVRVRVIDCFGNVVSEGNSTKDIYYIGAAGRWEEYHVTFRASEMMSNVRRVEVYVEDLSAVTIETMVKTVTINETVTETLTHWITHPASTTTKTLTTTATQIATVTTNTPTTTTITATRTITSYRTTVTVTMTTTRFTTSTSVIRTATRTVTVSVPTATQRVTATSTVVTTIPTTTIRYTLTSTSTTTFTPPPETKTITETKTTTVATTTVESTTTIGTTLTSTVTRTATTTVRPCPSLYQLSSLHLALAALFLAPIFMVSVMMRRCRR